MSLKCPMCNNLVESLKSGSHILPRFFLRPIRSGKNGAISYVDVFRTVIDSKVQDLPKGTFICDGCETFTADLDGMGAKTLNLSPGCGVQIKRLQIGKLDYEVWAGINFSKFRNFLLSVVVRDHCWRKSEGMPLLMKDSEFEKLRTLIMDKNNTELSDDNKFPIIIHRISTTIIPNLHKSTSTPVISVTQDAITFMGMGYAVMIYFRQITDGNMKVFVDTFKLRKNGEIRMPIANLFNIGTWRRSEKVIVKAYQEHEKKLSARAAKRKSSN